MKKYILFAAALTVLAACNKDENYSEETNDLVEIRLTSNIQVQTRSAHDLDTYLAEGEEVHVWVDDTGGDAVLTPNLYVDNVLTVQEDNASLSGGETMYFPTTGNNVDIYAIHGNFGSGADLSESFWNSAVTHSVEQDQQSGEGKTGYALSDLVYGKSTDIERTKSAVPMTLAHMLSKVEVVLKQGDGSPVISKAEIINTQLEASFTPDKTSEGITVTAAGTTGENPIVIDNAITAEDATVVLNEAIIVPQTLASGTKFIRVTTDQGGELHYTLPAETEFQAGMKYRYNITANLTELTVTTEITDWSDGGTTDSTATM